MLYHTLSASEQAKACLQNQDHVRDRPVIEGHTNVERSTQRPHEACCASRKGTETEQMCIHHEHALVEGTEGWNNQSSDLSAYHHSGGATTLNFVGGVNVVTLQVSHSCAYSHNSLPRPQSCSRDIDGRLREAAQKPPNSIWQGKPAC